MHSRRSLPVKREAALEAALRLSEDDRRYPASELLATLPVDPPGLFVDDPGLMAELQRRSGDLAGSVTWEQLRDELRQM